MRVRPRSEVKPQLPRPNFTDASPLPHPRGGVDGHTLVLRVIGDPPKAEAEAPWVPPRMEWPTVSLAVLDPGMWYPDAPLGDETPVELYAQGASLPLPPSQQSPRAGSVQIDAEDDPNSGSPWLHRVHADVHENAEALAAEALAVEARLVPVAARTWFRAGSDSGERHGRALTAFMGSVPTKQERWDAERDRRMADLGRYQKVTPVRPDRRPGSLDTGVLPTVVQGQFDAAPSSWEMTR